MSGSTLVVEPFTFMDQYLSEIYSEEEYRKAFTEDILTQEELLDQMLEDGRWSKEEEEELESIGKKIETMKLDYFKNFYSDLKPMIAKAIKSAVTKNIELFNKKFKYNHLTCEYIKSQHKLLYLLQRSIKDQDGNKVDIGNFSPFALISKYNEEMLSDEEIRRIAKSDLRSIWIAHKGTHTLFHNENLTSMQLNTITWCKIYDNVYESMDCPSDQIISDDYALDGWFLHQAQKRQEDKKKSELENKAGGAAEVFLPARTKEEMKAIYDLNSMEAKRKLALLDKDLEKGSVDAQNLSSVKQEVAMLANKAGIEAMRRRK